MKVSEHWLRELADPALDSDGLADLLTFGGIEVESVEAAAPPFERVVAGEVVAVEKHPQADRLNVCQVNIGTAPLTIVCGAPNVKPGMRVPVALAGAKLPGLEIRLAKVRGVESQGMLCSAGELGMADDAEGLLQLPTDAALGADVRDVLGLDDRIFTTKATPNRGDCLSVLGLAREVAALSGAPLRWPQPQPVAATISDGVDVRMEAAADCPLYCARRIRNIDALAATPEWMRRRLLRSGLRSISPVVDVTNYVLLEMGQPLHAFDAAKVQGGIIVRRGHASEQLKLLNGITLELDPRHLVIADAAVPLALAGFMGGEASGVTSATSDIILESAFFVPEVVAGRSRELGFGSDSAYRFERGVDFSATAAAMERATRLILEICGGHAGPVRQVIAELPQRRPVSMRLARAARVLGFPVKTKEAELIFARLGFQPKPAGDRIDVTPPSHRFDIAIEEDLIEEFARVHGYEHIPALPPQAPARLLPVTETRRSIPELRRLFAALDYQEAVTYSFVDRQWETDLCGNVDPVALANPIASQMSVMRSSLFGGLLHAAAFNVSHQQTRVRLFEIGRCFPPGDGLPQPWRAAALAFGPAEPLQWGVKERKVDFYDVKADLEHLFAPRRPLLRPEPHPALHPGKSARIMVDGREQGWIGELHPRWQRKYGLPAAPILLEVELEALQESGLPSFREIPRFPAIRRDLAAEFDQGLDFDVIQAELWRDAPPILRDLKVFDLYCGQGVEKGKKSLAFSVLLQDTEKTLTDADAEKAVAELRRILQQKFNAKLR
ncbi:MAG: phenylalanine--tRNA ligase subunit beta [Betaproteobacteria bacterium]